MLRVPKIFSDSMAAICEKISRINGRVYLVGGCVRDLILGQIPGDLDLEIFGVTARKLEAIFGDDLEYVGKQYGIYRLKNLPIDIGIPRRESKTGYRHRDFAINFDPHMALADAAARRDFTINAIYWDPIGGKFEDPFNGRKDLSRRILRHVSSRFVEDPLRPLRAMQFIGRFDLGIDEKTVALCRGLDPTAISAERIFDEFRKLIRFGINIGRGLGLLETIDWLKFFPELDVLSRCQQDPIYHPEGSVWNHIRFALDAFARDRPTDLWDRLVVGFAVLCHDFGKPKCTHWNAVGRLSSRGHEEAGLEPAKNFLTRLRAPKKLVEEVLPLIRFHMLPRYFDRREQKSNRFVLQLANSVGRIDRLVLVAKADAGGRPPLTPDCKNEDKLLERARKLNIDRCRPMPLISGRDLVAMKLRPSPRFGTILRQMFEAQLEEKFTTREEAMRYLNNFLHALSHPRRSKHHPSHPPSKRAAHQKPSGSDGAIDL